MKKILFITWMFGVAASLFAQELGREYEVVKGDWLSKIAQREYGSVEKWKELVKWNPQIPDGNKIYYGERIFVPKVQYLSMPRIKEENYRVLSGDSYKALSIKLFGLDKRWKAIAAWNDNKDLTANIDIVYMKAQPFIEQVAKVEEEVVQTPEPEPIEEQEEAIQEEAEVAEVPAQKQVQITPPAVSEEELDAAVAKIEQKNIRKKDANSSAWLWIILTILFLGAGAVSYVYLKRKKQQNDFELGEDTDVNNEEIDISGMQIEQTEAHHEDEIPGYEEINDEPVMLQPEEVSALVVGEEEAKENKPEGLLIEEVEDETQPEIEAVDFHTEENEVDNEAEDEIILPEDIEEEPTVTDDKEAVSIDEFYPKFEIEEESDKESYREIIEKEEDHEEDEPPLIVDDTEVGVEEAVEEIDDEVESLSAKLDSLSEDNELESPDELDIEDEEISINEEASENIIGEDIPFNDADDEQEDLQQDITQVAEADGFSTDNIASSVLQGSVTGDYEKYTAEQLLTEEQTKPEIITEEITEVEIKKAPEKKEKIKKPEALKKSDIVEYIIHKFACTKKTAKTAVDEVFNIIADGLKKEHDVRIREFFHMTVKKNSRYNGRNPKTGEEIKVPAKKVVNFKMGKELFELLNK